MDLKGIIEENVWFLLIFIREERLRLRTLFIYSARSLWEVDANRWKKLTMMIFI